MIQEIDFNYDNELVADATESIVECGYLQDTSAVWIQESFENNSLVLLLVDSKMDQEELKEAIIDQSETKRFYFGKSDYEYRVKLHYMRRYDAIINSKYVLALAYGPHLKKDIKHKKIKQVPESALMVAKGVALVDKCDFVGAKDCLESADSLGNGAAAFYLYKMYSFGWGCEPDETEIINIGNKYLKRAADNGSRSAQYVLGKRMLSDPDCSLYDIGRGINYLSRASVLKTVASVYSVNTSFDANHFLCNYYRTHHKDRMAYDLSAKFLKAYDDPDARCTAHLINCLCCDEYKEALEIIELGEKNQHPYTYVIHAQLLMNGRAGKRDFKKAEALLRYAADSLNYSNAYHVLAGLYRYQMKDGAAFLEALDNVNYSFEVK